MKTFTEHLEHLWLVRKNTLWFVRGLIWILQLSAMWVSDNITHNITVLLLLQTALTLTVSWTANLIPDLFVLCFSPAMFISLRLCKCPIEAAFPETFNIAHWLILWIFALYDLCTFALILLISVLSIALFELDWFKLGSDFNLVWICNDCSFDNLTVSWVFYWNLGFFSNSSNLLVM